MEAKVCGGEANTSEDYSLLELWHKWFGYVGEKSLLHLVKEKHLPDFKGVTRKSCIHCLAGKQHCVFFLNKVHARRKNVLDLVH